MKTIAIVAGGNSPEFAISVKSAEGVRKALSSRYNTYIIMIKGAAWYWEDSKGKYLGVDKNDFSLMVGDSRIRFDAVFISIHGTPGENGLLQGYFEMLGIPYTSCGPFCSALTFNKQACKLFLKDYAIPMADSLLVYSRENADPAHIIARTGLPCFVKPNDSGSSFGVSKVKSPEELFPAMEKAFAESREVVVESFRSPRL